MSQAVTGMLFFWIYVQPANFNHQYVVWHWDTGPAAISHNHSYGADGEQYNEQELCWHNLMTLETDLLNNILVIWIHMDQQYYNFLKP